MGNKIKKLKDKGKIRGKRDWKGKVKCTHYYYNEQDPGTDEKRKLSDSELLFIEKDTVGESLSTSVIQ